jgi:hypothetical protein
MQQVERNLSPMLPRNSNSNEETKGAEGEGVAVAGDDLEELSIDVSLPQVTQEYVTEKLLVMSYIDGFKVNEEANLFPFFNSFASVT